MCILRCGRSRCARLPAVILDLGQVMPWTTMAVSASRTASILNGLMMAMISFMRPSLAAGLPAGANAPQEAVAQTQWFKCRANWTARLWSEQFRITIPR